MVRFIHIDKDDRERGPVAFARRVHEEIQEMEEGETIKVSGGLATVTVEDNPFGGFNMKLGFHENKMEVPFVFRGARAKLEKFPDEIKERMVLLFNKPASSPMDLGHEIGTLADILQIVYDLNQWEFAKLDAASIGGMGQLTDYEFTYQSGTPDGSIRTDIDEAVQMSTLSTTFPQDDIETIFGLEVD